MGMRVLVATDGQPAAMGALRAARALAEDRGASVEVVTIVPPFPILPSRVGAPTVMPLAELDHARIKIVREQAMTQLAQLGSGAVDWPVTVEVGPVASTIVRVAQATAASLIVLGHARHELLDRLFGTETALQVMRLAHVPVLAVPAESRELPRTAVAAVDFSEFSRDAARTAVDLLGRPAELHLAHVPWRPLPDMPRIVGPEWVESYHESTRLQLQELAEALESAGEGRVEAHLLEGDPAREVLRLAEAVGAELIAAGSHGAGFFSRLVMGSVSTQLVRRATCAVLIAPPRSLPAEFERAWRQGRESTTASAPAHAGSAG